MKKLRLLFYNSYYAAGGVEVFMRTVIDYLAEKGYDVTVSAAPKQESDYHHPFGQKVKTVNRVLLQDRYRKHSLLWFTEHAVYRLREGLIAFWLSARRYDVVIAAQEKWVMKNAARIKGKRRIGWIHTDYSTRLKQANPVFASVGEELACLRSFDRVVCVSETARESLIRTIGDPGNLRVCYNPIDVKGIRQAAALPCPLSHPKDRFLLVAVGRLDPEKQYLMLLKACAELKKGYPFDLWIAGEGTQRREIEDYIAQEKLDNVKLLGVQSNPYHYLAQADLFVSASATEGYGLAIQEALILGVPVTAVRCPALLESFDQRFGTLTENSAEALEEAMRQYLAAPETLKACRERIRQDYPTEKQLFQDRLEAIRRVLVGEE